MKIKLIELNAYHFSESDGDELFLKIEKKRVWPSKAKFERIKSNSVTLNMLFDIPQAAKNLKVELWEYDNIFSSTCIGEFNLYPDSKGGPYMATMTRRSKIYASYALSWEVM